MPSFRVRWTQTAQRDLEDILDYIAADDLDAARKVLARLRERASALEELPGRGRVVPELRELDVFAYREVIEHPWRIVYRIEAKRVDVVAVLDGRRALASTLLDRLTRQDE